MRAAVAVVLAVAPFAGCQAIDDFSPFHVVASDGGSTKDIAALTDLSVRDDFAIRDLAVADILVLTQPNCAGLPSTCGPSGDATCCKSAVVTGGGFNRGNEVGTPATVSDFQLDTYEVTVGRFRAFVNSGHGTKTAPPAAGDGLHPKVPGTGWDAAWNANLAPDGTALIAALKCGGPASWSDAPGANENRPITCITWFEAFAFCAWDGARLPTSAEWNYAAAGGSQQRTFPWNAGDIDHTRAAFDGDPLADVGSRSTRGDSRWGQADLAGNVWEWAFDYAAAFPLPCIDCANTTPSAGRDVWGGSILDGASALVTSSRVSIPPGRRQGNIGVRCARKP